MCCRIEPIAESVDESRFLRLGGVDQWVMIRGQNLENPPLVLLHGGPGFSETHFFVNFNAALETSFNVVYWDQRGAGKSFDRHLSKSTLTVEQCFADLDELVDAVLARLHHDKVVLFGHSWGSLLGALYAACFPEKVAAYVGSAQIGDWPATESASYHMALNEAERTNNRKIVKKLRAIGPPPYSAREVWIERTSAMELDRESTLRTLWNFVRLFIGRREFSIFDAVKVMRHFRSSFAAMWREVSQLNLFELVPELQMPVFFFCGRRDRWVPPHTSVAYFEALRAPSKQLVWFDESGHEPFVDEPDKFNRTMIEIVRPAAVAPAVEPARHSHG